METYNLHMKFIVHFIINAFVHNYSFHVMYNKGNIHHCLNFYICTKAIDIFSEIFRNEMDLNCKPVCGIIKPHMSGK